MLERRLQILLDEVRYQRLSTHATRRGVSVARVVRDALDQFFGAGDRSRAAAAGRILRAEPMPVGDPAELRAEIRELRDRRT